MRGSLRPERQFGQVGAEIVGSDAAAADVEVIVMATSALTELGVDELTVDLGMPNLVPAILAASSLTEEALRTRLRLALDRKDVAAIDALTPALGGRRRTVVHSGEDQRAGRSGARGARGSRSAAGRGGGTGASHGRS